MSPVLDVNLKGLPDRMEQVVPGLHVFEIKTEPEVSENSKKTGFNLVVTAECVDDTESKDVEIRDWISLNNKLGLIRLRRFSKACGMDPDKEDINNTALFIGKTFKAVTTTRSVSDEASGLVKSLASLQEYVIPGEEVTQGAGVVSPGAATEGGPLAPPVAPPKATE